MKAPYLYRATVTLRSSKGAILDRVTQPLGLRTMRFDAGEGFFLNGEPLFLKGVGLHQDRPVKGWAVSRADQEQDLDIFADMGANAVRLAHYQHDSGLLRCRGYQRHRGLGRNSSGEQGFVRWRPRRAPA